MREGRIRALFGAVVAGMLVYCATHLELSTDVTNFLPEGSTSELADLASRLADSELTRTMIITVGAPDADTAVRAARALARRLRDDPQVARLRAGLDPDQLEEVYRLYFPRRHRFLSSRPEEEIPAMLAPQALRERAAAARRSLALPTSALSERLIAADPLGAFEGILRRFRERGPSELETHDGGFVTGRPSDPRRFGVLFLLTRASAFDSVPQSRLLARIDAAFRDVQREVAPGRPGDLVMEMSGANRFAVASEQSMRRDVAVIATTSFLGVAAVFLAFLRSLRFFALAVLPPLAGILTAATATRMAFGRLDGLTMAFGTSLIGVAIDYSIHVLDHHRLEPGSQPREIVQRLRPSLVLGALTTMASFAGLAITSFPGFREIGFFAIVGVGASLVVTLTVLPGFLSPAAADRDAPSLARRVARALGVGMRWLEVRRRALALVPLACVVATVALLPRLRFEDDLSKLMTLDPSLRAEEDRVRARVGGAEAGRAVFALGDDVESALERNDRVALRLERARQEGAIEDYRSLHALLWSRDLQDRNLRALRAVPHLADRVESAFAAEGFRPGALAPFRAAVEGPPPPPLDAATLRASPLGDLVAPMLLDLGDRTAVVTQLGGVASLDGLAARLADLDHVLVLDQKSFVNGIYREFRVATLEQIGVGSVLVVLVLALRYRRWRPALAAFLPSLLVAGTLLAVFAAFGVGVNLLHVTSLILVMGMGVDYGIFVVDSAGDARGLDATLLSLLLSCLTTVFVFGTLVLSQHGALRAIGSTTGLGIALSFALAPLTLVVLRRAGQPGRG